MREFVEPMERRLFMSATGVNHSPEFVGALPGAATAENAYAYDIQASDADGDPLSFSGVLPDWLILMDNGNGTATLAGAPTDANAGANEVKLTVSDGKDIAEYAFTIQVAAVHHAPEFIGDVNVSHDVPLGTDISRAIAATDADGDHLSFEMTDPPDWLQLLDNGDGTAAIVGTPTKDHVGQTIVEVVVSDGTRSVTQKLVINVQCHPAYLADDGTLYVNGGDDNDTIQVWNVDDSTVRVKRNDLIRNFDADAVSRLAIWTYDGDDIVTINAGLLPTYVLSGMGDDTITGGLGDDILTGGGGRDLIFGNAGDDRLNGSGGSDKIFGGEGNDRLFAGNGRDVLDGGLGSNRLHGDQGTDIFLSDELHETEDLLPAIA